MPATPPTPSAEQRPLAPFGRRRCEVVANEATGGYRIVSALDSEGPLPRAGQFYMLTAERWGAGSGERPYLPRAFSVATAEQLVDGARLGFLLEAVGPGTERLAELVPGDDLHLTGPLGRAFSMPRQISPSAGGAILVGGGIGIAPLALLRRELARAGIPQRVLLGFRDRTHAGGLDLFDCTADPLASQSATRPSQEIRTASEDGHTGHRGYVTDLLAVLLAGDDAGSAPVYACGPPAMLEAVRLMCAEHGVGAELAMEAPMACGFGSCFGCAVPLARGGFMRLCVDGPVVGAAEVESALLAGSGHR